MYQGLMLDWGLVNQAIIHNPRLWFDIRGLFFEKDGSEDMPTNDAPPMPYLDGSSPPAALQTFISDYTLNSLAGAFV